ncbi:MAG: anti-anti-sigma factor [Fibrobacter sp.]|nr:anti-anti-sigma factor [Fibrobacter sp.]
MTQENIKNIGSFLVLPAPLNPIGAFDAEAFKASFRSLVDANAEALYIAVDLSGLDFVYSDAYNAFMQCHQELSNKNGLFAVLADMESLASSLRKVGLERFIRIFSKEEDMAAYVPVNASKISKTPPKNETDLKSPNIPAAATTDAAAPAASEAPVTETAPATPAAPEKKPEFHGLDKNPLEDESSSSGGCVFVVVVLLIVIAVAAYIFM